MLLDVPASLVFTDYSQVASRDILHRAPSTIYPETTPPQTAFAQSAISGYSGDVDINPAVFLLQPFGCVNTCLKHQSRTAASGSLSVLERAVRLAILLFYLHIRWLRTQAETDRSLQQKRNHD